MDRERWGETRPIRTITQWMNPLVTADFTVMKHPIVMFQQSLGKGGLRPSLAGRETCSR